MKNLNYLSASSTLTLREGIRELRQAEGVENDAAQNVSPELVNDLDVHDAIHVLFACPTNLAGEISAHIWTVFGTTMKLKDMHRVNMHNDHRQVLTEIGHGKLVRTWFKSIPLIFATLFRSIRMKRRWPAAEFETYLNIPLDQLRKQFGIRLPVKQRSSDETMTSGAALRHIRSGLEVH